MDKQKKQADPVVENDLLRQVQDEVSAENAPLLRYIVRYSGYILAVVIGLLLLVGASGIRQWYVKKQQEKYNTELAQILRTPAGEAKVQALQALSADVPNSLKWSVDLELGRAALQAHKPLVAAEAYASIAKGDAEGATGLMATLGQASCLLTAGQYKEALDLLQALSQALPADKVLVPLQEMQAEAALKSGQKELAAQILTDLATKVQDADADYYRARAKAL